MTRIALEQVQKRFGDRLAIDGLSFSVNTPGVIGLLGPNGAGKTTTFKLLLGMLQPTAGRARVNDFDAAKEPSRVRAACGYMPDEPAFYDYLSGHEVLGFVCEVRGLDAARMWAWLDPIVQQLEAEAVLATRCGAFSLGMRKKLALLCAVAHEPKILLLDEPTNGLDPPSAAHARELFARLARDHDTTVLLSTHLLDLAERAADRLVVLDRGRLVADGTLAELRARTGLGEGSLEAIFLNLTDRGVARTLRE